jgi:hypothetical protein
MSPEPVGGTVFRVISSGSVGASAAVAYRLIADYQGGHQRILPARYFGNFCATKGGYGEGTEIAFEMYPFASRPGRHPLAWSS